MMNINGYHHIGLVVKDIDRSMKFYVDGLGGKVIHHFPMRGTDKTIYLVDLGGNAVVEIIPRGNGEEESNARWAHIALAAEDVWAAHDMAVKTGAVTQDAPKHTILGTMKASNAFVVGPDGETIEFFHVESMDV